MAEFKKGDKVRVSGAGFAGLDIGTIAKVVRVDGAGDVYLDIPNIQGSTNAFYLRHNVELVEPSEASRISSLETEVAELREEIDTLKQAKTSTVHNVTINTQTSTDFRKITDELYKVVSGQIHGKLVKETPKSANERRADVIKRAKAFVVDIVGTGDYFTYDIGGYKNQAIRPSFHVNTEKRAVTVLIHGHYSGRLYTKGIAKCDPSDVFNADIGKAIALGRALGVNCPTEFVKAVQPTELVIGQRAYICPAFPNDLISDRTSVEDGTTRISIANLLDNKRILDDTDAEYV